MKTTALILLLLLAGNGQQQVLARKPASPQNPEIMGRRVSKTLQFLSPLQSLTLFPKEIPPNTPRDDFLPKFQAGLAAETKAKEYFAKRRELAAAVDGDYVGEGWEKRSEEADILRSRNEERAIDRSWDRATAPFANKGNGNRNGNGSDKLSSSKYQFVGVVQSPESDTKVKWYARKRPADSKWNIRLLHVNKDAILKDLFTSGKVDVMAKYVNTGKPLDPIPEGEDTTGPKRPLIEGQYSIKPRSWMNGWNFSPKHFFTDSSGAFWRERRLSPGLYTDGQVVYESKYRYTDGKNGMKPISKLDALLRSKAIKNDVKTDLLKRLQKDSPDIVIED